MQLELAAELGFRDDAALHDARRFAAFAPEARQRALAELERSIDLLPVRQPGNRDRRAQIVREEALEAPERTTEKRERSVSVNRDSIKREKTDPYLRDLYTNPDGVTFCQACRDRLPFKLPDGSYFFESVEFLPGLRRHYHQNYLALCPNHAAMFMYANDSRDELKSGLIDLDGGELELTLAGRQITIFFTDTHIEDLRIIVEVDNRD